MNFCPKCGRKLLPAGEKNEGAEPEADAAGQLLNVEEQGRASASVGSETVVPKPLPGLERGFKAEYFSFKGRLNRKRYFWRSLVAGVSASLVGIFFGGGIGYGCATNDMALAIGSGLLLFLVLIPWTVIGVSLGVRRCHDLDKTGWFYLGYMIPYVNLALSIYLLFARGTEGDNQYGQDVVDIEGW